jgi:hypothetical protein
MPKAPKGTDAPQKKFQQFEGILAAIWSERVGSADVVESRSNDCTGDERARVRDEFWRPHLHGTKYCVSVLVGAGRRELRVQG